MSQRDGKGALRWAVGIIAGVVVLYLGLFLLAVLDEMVLGTYWFEEFLPDVAYDAIGVLMAPMSWLLKQMGLV